MEYIYSYDPVVYWIISSQICDCLCSERAVWHLPIDFFYYTTPDMGLVALASQFVTCISLGIFMAYTYMKTQNIWVPIIIHFLNNNMMVVFAGTDSADVLQNQQIHWGAIPVALVMNLLIYGWVIFLKPFKEKKA